MPSVAFMVLLAVTGFAANSVLARLALGTAAIDAAGYTGIRLLAGAVMLALLAGRHRPLALGRAVRTPARWITAASLFGYAITFSFAYQLLDTGTGALILFTTVQAGMLGWALLKGDRPGPVALTGIAAAFGGFVYLVSPGLVAPHPLGAALMIAAGLSWAVYSLVGRGSAEPLADTAYNFILTAPLALGLLVVSLLYRAPDPIGVGWAVASGALASGAGYAVWYKVLPLISRSTAAIVQLLAPVIAAAGGVLLMGETVSLRLVVASLLILGGVAVAIVFRRQAG
ncbi:DMT family transporter [Devosia sp.]|uniref:DMT family transporter n=1 Tax=Devosia sp. TaxID=1871048 RepID=UPI002EDD131B